MTLSVAERILLLNVMPPAEGPLALLQAVRGFREEISFTPQEQEAIGLSVLPDRVTWNPGPVATKEVDIDAAVAVYLAKCIRDAKSLKEEHLEFYMGFLK